MESDVVAPLSTVAKKWMVAPGSTWPSGPVTVSFAENAKQCDLSTEATGFNLADGEECYLAEMLTRGTTASMYFNEPGLYKYHLEMAGKTTGAEGPGRTKNSVEGVIEVVKAQ